MRFFCNMSVNCFQFAPYEWSILLLWYMEYKLHIVQYFKTYSEFYQRNSRVLKITQYCARLLKFHAVTIPISFSIFNTCSFISHRFLMMKWCWLIGVYYIWSYHCNDIRDQPPFTLIQKYIIIILTHFLEVYIFQT